MRADTVIRSDGLRALFEKLEPLEAERFLVLLRRGGIDYTEWQKKLWEDRSVDEIHERAAQYWEQKKGADG
jgi:hypothetical protein